jgi:dual specificity tyrosine-phosphorylation-regulated kinase 2/3/4
MSFFKIGQRTP